MTRRQNPRSQVETPRPSRTRTVAHCSGAMAERHAKEAMVARRAWALPAAGNTAWHVVEGHNRWLTATPSKRGVIRAPLREQTRAWCTPRTGRCGRGR